MNPCCFSPLAGSEDSVDPSPVPWGVPASCSLCMYCCHAVVPVCFNYHLYCASQVRTDMPVAISNWSQSVFSLLHKRWTKYCLPPSRIRTQKHSPLQWWNVAYLLVLTTSSPKVLPQWFCLPNYIHLVQVPIICFWQRVFMGIKEQQIFPNILLSIL